MAFLKRKSRLPHSILFIFLVFLLSGAVAGGLYYLYQKQFNTLKAECDDKIEGLMMDLYMLERQVYIPKDDVPCGAMLTSQLFTCTGLKLDIPQEELLEESDMGKVSIMELKKGIPVTKAMVSDSNVSDELRELEFNMFLIQTDQSVGDYVDIRIMFPNGENYIVLGKKQMKGLNRAENIVTLWLDEYEIQRISSAIIDIYQYPGTKIYIATYVCPELQKESIPFYPVNIDVLELIRKDPNLRNKAGDILSENARMVLESHIKAIGSDVRGRITSGVETEISKTIEIIQSREKEKETEYSEQETEEMNEESEESNDASKTNPFK